MQVLSAGVGMYLYNEGGDSKSRTTAVKSWTVRHTSLFRLTRSRN